MLLASRSWGEGSSKVALLVHGGRDASTTWKKVGPWLANRGWHAIAVDLRGHGQSQIDPASCDRTLSTPAADLLETLAALRPDVGGVDLLVGHSFGALVCLTCVAEHPTFARRLVIEDPVGPSFDPIEGADSTANLIALARSHPSPAEVLPERSSVESDELADKAAAAAATDPVYLPEVMRTFVTLDLNGLAVKCPVPSLLIVGRDKGEVIKLAWPAISEYSSLCGDDRKTFFAALRQGTLVELEAGHYVHTKAFPKFVESVDRWLANSQV
jgi:pimeloyl-ACP methyl ester carboxylesterase